MACSDYRGELVKELKITRSARGSPDLFDVDRIFLLRGQRSANEAWDFMSESCHGGVDVQGNSIGGGTGIGDIYIDYAGIIWPNIHVQEISVAVRDEAPPGNWGNDFGSSSGKFYDVVVRSSTQPDPLIPIVSYAVGSNSDIRYIDTGGNPIGVIDADTFQPEGCDFIRPGTQARIEWRAFHENTAEKGPLDVSAFLDQHGTTNSVQVLSQNPGMWLFTGFETQPISEIQTTFRMTIMLGDTRIQQGPNGSGQIGHLYEREWFTGSATKPQANWKYYERYNPGSWEGLVPFPFGWE